MNLYNSQQGFGVAGILSIITAITIMISVGWLFWQNFIVHDLLGESVSSSETATDSIVVPSPSSGSKSTSQSANSIVVQ